jgi:hypothetical protein
MQLNYNSQQHKNLSPWCSLILLFLLLKNVTTSSKIGSGGADLPRHRADRVFVGHSGGGGGGSGGGGGVASGGGGSGGNSSLRDALFINGEVIPTAAAIEAAGRLAANLAEYIRRTCQVPVMYNKIDLHRNMLPSLWRK